LIQTRSALVRQIVLRRARLPGLDESGSGSSIARPAPRGKHVECSLARSSARDPPFDAAGQASKLSADVLQHRLVEGQIRDNLLQLAVLLLELAQSLHL
jgi:hypothetical protein